MKKREKFGIGISMSLGIWLVARHPHGQKTRTKEIVSHNITQCHGNCLSESHQPTHYTHIQRLHMCVIYVFHPSPSPADSLTLDLAQVLILCSIIEECVTILAGSMPSLRVLFVRMRGSHNRPSSFSFVKHSSLKRDRTRKFPLRLPGSKKRAQNTWGRPGEDIQMVAMHENNSEQGIIGRQTPESSTRHDRYPGGGGEASIDLFGSPSGYSAEVQKV